MSWRPRHNSRQNRIFKFPQISHNEVVPRRLQGLNKNSEAAKLITHNNISWDSITNDCYFSRVFAVSKVLKDFWQNIRLFKFVTNESQLQLLLAMVRFYAALIILTARWITYYSYVRFAKYLNTFIKDSVPDFDRVKLIAIWGCQCVVFIKNDVLNPSQMKSFEVDARNWL